MASAAAHLPSEPTRAGALGGRKEAGGRGGSERQASRRAPPCCGGRSGNLLVTGLAADPAAAKREPEPFQPTGDMYLAPVERHATRTYVRVQNVFGSSQVSRFRRRSSRQSSSTRGSCARWVGYNSATRSTSAALLAPRRAKGDQPLTQGLRPCPPSLDSELKLVFRCRRFRVRCGRGGAESA